MKHRILSLLMLAFTALAYAQPVATAGPDTTLCNMQGATTQLNVSVTGGTPPYTYLWSQHGWMSSLTVPNPLVAPELTTTYTVTVTDAISQTATSSMTVNVLPKPVIRIGNISSSGLCVGSSIGLSSYGSIMKSGPAPYQAGISNPDTLGNAHELQSGNQTQLPYMFSNLVQSHRQQMLYRWSEMQDQVNGYKVLRSIAFSLSQFASNATIQNLEIKIGVTSQSSLTDWENIHFTTVYSAANYTPVSGWNNFTLQTPYYVAGENIVVEICSYNPSTSGNLANKAVCSNTTFNSYAYTASNSNLCGVGSSPTLSGQRPIMLFRCSNLAFTPTHTYEWSVDGNASIDGNLGITSIHGTVYDTAVYTVIINNNYGCADTATVLVEPDLTKTAPTIDSIEMINSTCHLANGSLTAYVTGCSPQYAWSSSGGTNSTLANRAQGGYGLTVTDCNNCRTYGYASIVSLSNINITAAITNVSCHGGNDGAINITTVTGGNAPYTYVWSHATTTEDQTGLIAGTYIVTITDALDCSSVDTFFITEPLPYDISYTNVVGATCGASDGSVCATPTGGTAPYTYIWSAAMTSSCPANLQAGIHTVTATDANGCTASGSVIIGTMGSTLAIIRDSIFHTTCSGAFDGRIYITPTGGVPPYQYAWSNTTNNEDITNLNAGFYTLTISDDAGCIATDTFTITEPLALVVDSITTTNVTCYASVDGAACVYVSGGAAPYTFQWQPSITNTGCGTNLTAGNYPVIVTDATGCTADTIVAIYLPPPFTVTINNNGDGIMPDTLTTTIIGGIPPYSYNWSTGATGNFPEQMYTDLINYRVTITDASGCSATTTIILTCPDTCVWPGDADYSGVADNNDLLAIGLGYGTTGTARPSPLQDILWYGHQSSAWVDYLGDSTNYKHIDCNGDGIINSDDTLAIIQNYSLTHPRSGVEDVRGGGIPALRIRMVPDTLEDGQTVIAHLDLGDANSTADNVYGLAFTFNFDPLVVDTNEVYITFNNNSWLCNTATDHIDIDKKDASEGKLHTALTRIDHTTRSGGGEIGNVSMKITTGNINGKDLAYYAMNTYITNLRVIDNQGNILEVDAIGDASTIQYEPTGINEINWAGEVSLYPNPAKQQLSINSTKMPLGDIQITNLLGETVLAQQHLNSNKALIDISSLADGIYIVKLKSGSSTYHTRFMVAK